MNEDRRKILDMLAGGRLTADEADRLLAALEGRAGGGAAGADPILRSSGPTPKYLRVQVSKLRGETEDAKNVNIRVPLQLLRAGVRLHGLLPSKARDELNAAFGKKAASFDFNQLRPENLDAFVAALAQASIDVDADDGRSKIKVSCE